MSRRQDSNRSRRLGEQGQPWRLLWPLLPWYRTLVPPPRVVTKEGLSSNGGCLAHDSRALIASMLTTSYSFREQLILVLFSFYLGLNLFFKFTSQLADAANPGHLSTARVRSRRSCEVQMLLWGRCKAEPVRKMGPILSGLPWGESYRVAIFRTRSQPQHY